MEVNQGIVPDFEAVIMKGAGNDLMLERPKEFNAHLRQIVQRLEKAAG
jgi:hypothetical protein